MNKSVPTASNGWLAKNRFLVFVAIYGLWVWTPFLAPLFMRMGGDGLAKRKLFQLIEEV